MQALSILSRQIGGFADEFDKETIENFKEQLAIILEITLAELENEISWEVQEDHEDEQVEILTEGDEILLKVGGEKKAGFNTRKFFEWATENPEKALDFISVMNLLRQRPPAQGILLRRGALVSLVSAFEILLAELINAYYFRNRAALSPEKSIKLSELRTFENIEDAEKYLIQRQTDEIIDEGLSKVIGFFQKQNLNLKIIQEPLDVLYEIFQRRNNFVHNNGIVDREYLSKVKPDYIDKKNLKLGNSLTISADYLQQAIDTTWYVGFALTQLCWRKWAKDERDQADKAIGDFTYNTLLNERYELTRMIALFSAGIKVSGYLEKTITINHAIALRELGETEKMKKLLRRKDLSDSKPHKMAIHILLNEVDEGFDLLPEVIEAAQYNSERKRMMEWPLFKQLRTDSRFINAFKNSFVNKESKILPS